MRFRAKAQRKTAKAAKKIKGLVILFALFAFLLCAFA